MNVYNEILNLLKKNKIQYNEHTHDEISTFEMGIKNTKFDITKIVKTLAFKVNENIILVSLLGIDKIDYKKLSNNLGISRSSLKMIEPNEIEKLGFEVGGVSPILPNSGCIVILDENLKFLDHIYCGIGLKNKTLEINPLDLKVISNADFFNISKTYENEEIIRR